MATDSLTFYDNYQTPLKAGSYRFVLQQTVKVEGEGARHYYRDQPFEVQAPRYRIDGSEIYDARRRHRTVLLNPHGRAIEKRRAQACNGNVADRRSRVSRGGLSHGPCQPSGAPWTGTG